MTTLLESPIPAILFGILVLPVLAAVFYSTRQAWALWAIFGVLVLVFAGVALEQLVVTEVEAVEATLDGASDALEANDLKRLLRDYISPDAVNTVRRAHYVFSVVEITSAKMSNMQITIDRLTSPPTAEAQFHGVVHYNSKIEQLPYRYYAAKFRVRLRREGDRWLVIDHVEHHEVR